MSLECISHHTSWFRELSAFLWLYVRDSKCWVRRGHKLSEDGAFLQDVTELESLLTAHAAEWGAAAHSAPRTSLAPQGWVGTSLGELGDISEWGDVAGLHLLFWHCASYNWEKSCWQELLLCLWDQNLWLHQWFPHVFSAFCGYWSAVRFWRSAKGH